MSRQVWTWAQADPVRQHNNHDRYVFVHFISLLTVCTDAVTILMGESVFLHRLYACAVNL